MNLALESWGDYDVQYGGLPVDGKTVLDLGAEYGSTARYFLGRGAQRVYVSEVLPEYRAALFQLAADDERILVLQPVDSAVTVERWLRVLRPGAVKIDIEGDERHLLGCGPEALSVPDAYVIETHGPELKAAITALLEGVGFGTRVTWQHKGLAVVLAEKEAAA